MRCIIFETKVRFSIYGSFSPYTLSASLKKYVSTIDWGSTIISFPLQTFSSLIANKGSQILHKQEYCGILLLKMYCLCIFKI